MIPHDDEKHDQAIQASTASPDPTRHGRLRLVYRVRWRRLLILAGVFVFVPIVVSIVSGGNVLPLAIGWALIFLIGAGGAGLRARGSAYQTPDQDFEQREAARQFERPRTRAVFSESCAGSLTEARPYDLALPVLGERRGRYKANGNY